MKYLIVTAAAFSWILSHAAILPAYAQENVKPIHEATHHNHDDVDKHNDHNENGKDHDDSGHDSHKEEGAHDGHGHDSDKEEDAHDEHGHGKSDAGHDNAHTGEDESHEEGKAQISPESVKRMGVVIEKAAPAKINQTISLTGRITLNQNSIADVHGRYTGIVRSVKVNLGEHVKKGQTLAVVEANDSLQDYNVIAPISGVVLERNTNIGDLAGDDAIFVIADLSNVWAKFHVFLRDSDFVQAGQKVTIYNLARDKSTYGKIDMFYPTADELSQTQVAIVVLPNSELYWKPGMIIEGDVNVAEDEEAHISVKGSALQIMKEYGSVVFVKEGEYFTPRSVKTGRKGNGFVEILQGLEAGELYVSKGSFVIKSDILKATAAHSH
jgi:cobalt-zinc-cadmium efflux system membrane fusion protein